MSDEENKGCLTDSGGFYYCRDCSCAPTHSKRCEQYRRGTDAKIGKMKKEFIEDA